MVKSYSKDIEEIMSYLIVELYDHNAHRHRVITHWLDGNLSNRTIQEALGLPEVERD